MASDGPVLGTFALYGPAPREPDEGLLNVVRYAAIVAATAIERERANERIVYEATHDAMTGLWNRARILELLSSGLSTTSGRNAPLAMLLVDLDRLTLFNDSFGHDLGDEVVAETSRRIADAMISQRRRRALRRRRVRRPAARCDRHDARSPWPRRC